MADWKAEARAKRAALRAQHTREGVPIALFAHGCFTRFNTTLHEIGMGTESDDEDGAARALAPADWARAADLEARLDALEPLHTRAVDVGHPRQPEAGPSRSAGTLGEVRSRLSAGPGGY